LYYYLIQYCIDVDLYLGGGNDGIGHAQ
jgi:hypothetical protein